MASRIIRFGLFTLEPDTGALLKGGTPVKIQEQSFQMLRVLLERPNQVVTRDELRERLWPETYVDFDLALNTTVRKTRRALGDSAENPRFIETVPKRGYRFIAPVEEVQPGSRSTVVEPVASSRNAFGIFHGRWVVGLGLVAIGVLFAGIWERNRRLPRSVQPIESIAVLPFVNRSGDAAIEYLSDGLSENLIYSLSELRFLRVMASGTTASFKGREVDPRIVGRELRVGAVVQGKVYKQGGLLTIDADLVDAATGEELWRNRYRRQISDALDLEQEISSDLTRKIQESLKSQNRATAEQFPRRSTKNKEAYQHYLQGLFQMRQLTSDAADQAVEHFEKAIMFDPDYALPYWALASTYEVLDDWVLAPREVIPKARAAIQKALDLDPSLSEAHTMMGTVHFWYDFDQAAAEKEFQRAIELNPSFDDAHDFYGWYLVCHKRFDQGLAENRRSVELSPFDLQHHLILAQSLYYSGRYDEALNELRITLLQNPNAWLGRELLGWVYEQKADLPRSIAELKKAVDAEHNIAEPKAALGRAYALSGNRQAANDILKQLTERSVNAHVARYALAVLHMGLGEDEQAIRELQMAFEERSWSLDFLAVDPKMERIRSDPRVQQILRQVGLQ